VIFAEKQTFGAKTLFCEKVASGAENANCAPKMENEEKGVQTPKKHWFYKGWAGGEAAGPTFGPKSCIFLFFLIFLFLLKMSEKVGKGLEFHISCCFRRK